MASAYLTPGVYMEEVDKGARPIEGVATSIAAFVGFAETGPLNQPTFITNWTQFQQTFGGFIPGSYLAHAVMGFFTNGGGTCYVTRLPTPETSGRAANDGAKMAATTALPTRGKAELSGLDVRALAPGSEGSQLSVQAVDPTPVEGQTLPEDVFT